MDDTKQEWVRSWLSRPPSDLRSARALVAVSQAARDTVLDSFAGSNTTGSAAERLGRRWLAFEKDRTYPTASAFRFVDELPAEDLATLWSRLHSDDLPVEVNRQQRELVLMEKPISYPRKTKPK